MADPAGRLNIRLRRLDGGLKATLESSRPTAASRVFAGKTVEETASGLPALFSICATAQACACASACEAALGLVPSPAVVRQRRLLVDAETVKEHLWRILLDWPRFLGEAPREEDMSRVLGAYLKLKSLLGAGADPMRPGADSTPTNVSAATRFLEELAGLSATRVLGTRPGDWLAGIRTPQDLLAWAENTDTAAARLLCRVQAQGWASAGRSQVTALPRLSARDLDRLLSDAGAERFAAEPLWRGQPRESSPFTRRQGQPPVAALSRELGNGLLPRLAARLVELATLQHGLPARLHPDDAPAESLGEGTGDGIGIAQVPAARGLLIHRAEVEQGRIRDYRILAPTEWNFHPSGLVARGLSSLPVADAATLEHQASLFVTAVDPCVEYTVTVS